MPVQALTPKYALVANTIEKRITRGTYRAGMRIPSEQQLMAEFEVSRPTVVRALDILRRDGLIVARQGQGRFVRAGGRAVAQAQEAAGLLRGAGWIAVEPQDAYDLLTDALHVASTGGCDHSAYACGECLASVAVDALTASGRSET